MIGNKQYLNSVLIILNTPCDCVCVCSGMHNAQGCVVFCENVCVSLNIFYGSYELILDPFLKSITIWFLKSF